MDCDGTMLSSDLPQDEIIDGFEGPYFYHVFSEHSATSYQLRFSVGASLFQSRCDFSLSYLSLDCIEEYLRLRDSRASPFITVFSDFAAALCEAYDLYVRGHEAIQIVQIQASGLVAVLVSSAGNHSAMIPIWQGTKGREDRWLCMADVGPLLGLDLIYIRSSEWLACGSISKDRFSAAWPIIDGRLHFNEGRSEDLVDFFVRVCGHLPECYPEHDASERYEYDWEGECFVGTERWHDASASIQETSVAGVGLGLGLAVAQFARPTPFGYAGYLRGMVVMD
ncbi:hypothetical protein BKA58DRAFT_387412 [Alternaria rosae]|uniref:uncharacterized protein n=1 Tax=Alternaria rosae TaxID=1187941 RepID=UPI001E8D291E|nr:uncharacterized protein BKA58DRAFT_387412 [Alternaria rosae]KAH6868690.1 hypothetical protein BKA58DRAFT_387412 [Alternaria rosae]